MKKHRKLGNLSTRPACLIAMGTMAMYAAPGIQNTAAAEPKLAHSGKQEQAAAFTFDIPAGPLATVLTQFRQISGIGTALHLPPESIAGFHSNGVNGSMTYAAALGVILEGTGLGYRDGSRRLAR